VRKIPSHIKIKNKVTYEVVTIKKFKDDQTLGECRPETRQIVIKEGQSDKETIKCFLHEVMHCVAIERGIELSHKSIYELEDALYYLIFHNKWNIK